MRRGLQADTFCRCFDQSFANALLVPKFTVSGSCCSNYAKGHLIGTVQLGLSVTYTALPSRAGFTRSFAVHALA